MKYDFVILREDANELIFTGAIIRRFLASIIDTLILGSVFIFFAQSVDGSVNVGFQEDLSGLYNLALLSMIFYVPEILYRRSFGMWLMGLVVIPPVGKNPYASIAIRKLFNIIEFAFPSIIYYFITALSKNCCSLSDTVSGCIVAKKSILDGSSKKTAMPNKMKRILIPIIFSALPTIFIFTFLYVIVFGGMHFRI